jgi:hypothetical protein
MCGILLVALLSFLPLQQNAQHQQSVMQHGDEVMGFSHEKATHHFTLYKDGGEIVVSANDPNDKTTEDQIRTHLGHIAKMFAAGNFNAPMLVHSATPPGTATMTKLKDQIRYEYSETVQGAAIRIVTSDPQAMDAIHAFLLFQIIDHQTGDAPAIGNVSHDEHHDTR